MSDKQYTTEELICFIDDVCGISDSWGTIPVKATTVGEAVGNGEARSFTAQDNGRYGERARLDIVSRLRQADKLCEAAIRVMGNLALRDDPEFAELNQAIDAYEEAGNEQNRRRRHNA